MVFNVCYCLSTAVFVCHIHLFQQLYFSAITKRDLTYIFERNYIIIFLQWLYSRSFPSAISLIIVAVSYNLSWNFNQRKSINRPIIDGIIHTCRLVYVEFVCIFAICGQDRAVAYIHKKHQTLNSKTSHDLFN